MTIDEIRICYPNYARKERELAERDLDKAGDHGKMKTDPACTPMQRPDLTPKHQTGDADGG